MAEKPCCAWVVGEGGRPDTFQDSLSGQPPQPPALLGACIGLECLSIIGLECLLIIAERPVAAASDPAYNAPAPSLTQAVGDVASGSR